MLWAILLGGLTYGPAWTAEEKPVPSVEPGSLHPELSESLRVTSPEFQPLNLLLTQPELANVVRRYEIRTGQVLTEPIDDDEVLVTAPGYVAPMRDVSQEAWGGIAAPFWAIRNPKDAWRIFVPIPPKGRQRLMERPAPDPR